MEPKLAEMLLRCSLFM